MPCLEVPGVVEGLPVTVRLGVVAAVAAVVAAPASCVTPALVPPRQPRPSRAVGAPPSGASDIPPYDSNSEVPPGADVKLGPEVADGKLLDNTPHPIGRPDGSWAWGRGGNLPFFFLLLLLPF